MITTGIVLVRVPTAAMKHQSQKQVEKGKVYFSLHFHMIVIH